MVASQSSNSAPLFRMSFTAFNTALAALGQLAETWLPKPANTSIMSMPKALAGVCITMNNAGACITSNSTSAMAAAIRAYSNEVLPRRSVNILRT